MENRTHPTPGPGTSTLLAEPARSAPHVPARTLRARRRRPAVLAMAVALIAAGGLGGAVLYNSTGQRIAVLALAHDVPYGQVLKAEDLVVARIASDPVLKPLSAADRAKAVGLRATTDLRQGALLLKADVAQTLTVEPGQLVVGVAAKRTQLPATKLQPGVLVFVVSTPDAGTGQADGGATRTPEAVGAVVTAIGKADPDGSQVIDVAVPSTDAPRLAAWVASAKFQVLLAPLGTVAAQPSGTATAGPAPSGPAPSGPAPSGSKSSGSAAPGGGS